MLVVVPHHAEFVSHRFEIGWAERVTAREFIEGFLLHGSCPRCGTEMMAPVNADATVCTNKFCRFAITGLERVQHTGRGDFLAFLEKKIAGHQPPEVREAIREHIREGEGDV